MPLPSSAGAGPGGTLSALSVLFLLFILLALDGGRPGEGQGVSRPGRFWRVVLFSFYLCVSFICGIGYAMSRLNLGRKRWGRATWASSAGPAYNYRRERGCFDIECLIGQRTRDLAGCRQSPPLVGRRRSVQQAGVSGTDQQLPRQAVSTVISPLYWPGLAHHPETSDATRRDRPVVPRHVRRANDIVRKLMRYYGLVGRPRCRAAAAGVLGHNRRDTLQLPG